ncbi:UTP--glucose-1-phosphate uridylyltransferase [Candidatus Saccharibacteria bacterium CG_4_10_14_0_2_um_filter_52_9]|nr:MAG: UTP--glucose-1-phosphate uridylyltransferase [Candidatus Saccharibacteria bacterium CG_4_10_14_0_2_um_filter_52_9]
MSQPKVTKAIIAAAGFGTRFLPQTKAMPKEMLPLVDKPIIQVIVEELVGAGITDIVIVTGYHKRTIEDHFDHIGADLKNNLEEAGKKELLEATERISGLANFAYLRQKGPYGTGTPLLNAAHLIGDESFIYTFADDFVAAKPSRFVQMLAAQHERGGSVITCVRRDGDEDYKRYGYVDGKEITPGLIDMTTIVEKPGKENAPSDLASVSGYVFEPIMIYYLQKQRETYDPASGEFMIQEAMQKMIEDGQHIYGCEIQNGTYYDTGNPLEYLKTVFNFAMQRPDIGSDLTKYLKGKLQ